jgi:hypothetical protein
MTSTSLTIFSFFLEAPDHSNPAPGIALDLKSIIGDGLY